MKKTFYKIIGVTILLVLVGFVNSDSDIYFQMSRSIDIFGRVYKEVALNYVDEVKPEPFMLEGIKGMLSTLDPYTVYIDEHHQKDIEIITKGKYGGIGATVGIHNNDITIVDLIEGYSAQRQGIRIGDVIVKVDSIEITRKNYSKLGDYLKKEPGTEISITIKREGVDDELVFNLISEEIEIKNLTYYGFVPTNSNNAYLKLSGFTKSAGDEIRKAIQELRAEKEIKSIVLDLRGNPGGLLDAAVDVSEKFLEKNKIVVSIKGRNNKKGQVYKAKEEPIAKDIKLAILVDNGSASASEIVTGAIQDHDRGIIVGTKSYGKGLVQTVVPLSFNTSLKLTTARYYTPSGRCIQKIDYSKGKEVFEDSITKSDGKFFTDNQREVFASGGITPDSIVINSSESHFVKVLLAKGMFFRFATSFFNTNTEATINGKSDDELFNDFMKHLKNQKFEYRSNSEKLLNELEETFEEDGYDSALLTEIEELKSKFSKVKENELVKYKKDIISEIKKELAARTDGRKGRIIE
jgi:carboxyl-terminal processing protease